MARRYFVSYVCIGCACRSDGGLRVSYVAELQEATILYIINSSVQCWEEGSCANTSSCAPGCVPDCTAADIYVCPKDGVLMSSQQLILWKQI